MALQWKALDFSYPGTGPVLPDWHWQAQPGLVQLVDGYSVGKTTVLQLLAGRLTARGGSLLIDEQTPMQWQAAHDLFWHEPRKPDTMPPDTTTLAQWADELRALFPRWDDALLSRLQQGFDLAGHWHKPLLALSTGSLRKAVLALGLASGAKLVLLDEPVSGLDKPALAWLEQVLQLAASRFAQQGCYLVLAHYEPLLPSGSDAVQTVVLPF